MCACAGCVCVCVYAREAETETEADRNVMKSCLMIAKAGKPRRAKLTSQLDSESWKLQQSKENSI